MHIIGIDYNTNNLTPILSENFEAEELNFTNYTNYKKEYYNNRNNHNFFDRKQNYGCRKNVYVKYHI